MKRNEKILTNLLVDYKEDFLPFTPFAKCVDRKSWQNLPKDICENIVKQGVDNLSYKYPMIPTTRYMDYLRNGNRTKFQDIYFERRRVVNAFVLAECCEDKDVFMDDVINGLMAICEESGWQLPSHNRYEDELTRHLIPDNERPIIDLFAAETGAQLAMIAYLLGEELNAKSPLFVERIKTEVKKRIEVPYLTEFFWWMGVEGRKLNNWTPWCTSNVLIATLLLDDISSKDKRKMIEKACESLDLFITGYEDDGFCEEGPSYYHAATLALFEAIRVLNEITNGHFSGVYEVPKIRNMVTYIMDVHIAKDIYTNYADCSSHLTQGTIKKYLAAKEINSTEMMQYAASIHNFKAVKTDTKGINLYEMTQELWYENDIKKIDMAKLAKRKDRFFEDAGVLVTRGETLFAAILGGKNTDPHGHNDKGSFIIYKNGEPLFIDAGVESYSKKTFSPERYSIWTMQTAFHNVITFDDVMQEHGEDYFAQVLDYTSNEISTSITYELAHAYPKGTIESYKRTLKLTKDVKLVITDVLSEVLPNTFLPLMTTVKPRCQNGYLYIGDERINIKGCALDSTEEIVFTDAKMKKDWGKSIYRTKLIVVSNEVQITIGD